jgi:hypothetical protein
MAFPLNVLHSRSSLTTFLVGILAAQSCASTPPAETPVASASDATAGSAKATPPASDASCISKRGVFEIGPTATKMKVAKIDTCTKKVLTIETDDVTRVDFQQNMTKNKGQLTADVVDSAAASIVTLKRIGEKLAPKDWVGIATGPLRTAKNGAEMNKRISEKTGIAFKVLTVEQEQELEFWAVAASSKEKNENVLVLSVGPTTSQFSALQGDRPKVVLATLGHMSFKDAVQTIKKAPKSSKSPNPISAPVAEQAENSARDQIRKMDSSFLALTKGKVAIGIGPVFWDALSQALPNKDNSYALKDIKAVVAKKAPLTDSQIGGRNPELYTSNLILAAGVMNGFGVDKVNGLRTELAHGALVMP